MQVIMQIEIDQNIRQLKTIAALYAKRSKFREAERVYRAILSLQEKHLGEYHSELALSFYHVAEVYLELKQYQLAKKMFERAVDIWERLSSIDVIRAEETIFFMDALVALRFQYEQEAACAKERKSSAA